MRLLPSNSLTWFLTWYCRSWRTSVMAFRPRCSLPIWQSTALVWGQHAHVSHPLLSSRWKTVWVTVLLVFTLHLCTSPCPLALVQFQCRSHGLQWPRSSRGILKDTAGCCFSFAGWPQTPLSTTLTHWTLTEPYYNFVQWQSLQMNLVWSNCGADVVD